MAIKEVIQLLDNTDPQVSREAALALCRMGSPEEINCLVQELLPEQDELHKKVEAAIRQAY
jgi:HEAT repeat protein